MQFQKMIEVETKSQCEMEEAFFTKKWGQQAKQFYQMAKY